MPSKRQTTSSKASASSAFIMAKWLFRSSLLSAADCLGAFHYSIIVVLMCNFCFFLCADVPIYNTQLPVNAAADCLSADRWTPH